MLSDKALINVAVRLHAPPSIPANVRVTMYIAVKLDEL